MAKMRAGERPQKELHLTAYDLLVSTNRETSGDGYRRLKEALERLSGTRITTNIRTKGEEITEGFGLLDSWRIVRKTDSGRMVSVKVSLSDWMYNAVLGHEVLTLHRDYFRLRKPLERRVYEIARKHCGQQDRWTIRLAALQKKCGSNSPLRVFRSMLKELVLHDHLPDYSISFEDDLVIFRLRESMKPRAQLSFPLLDPETYNDVRAVAPGYDPYFLEQEWREWWVDSGCIELQHPDKAFIAFCKKRYERTPNP
jgi:plasmid replication initiation protein